MKKMIINKNGQLRSGWKIAVVVVSFFIASIIASIIVVLFIGFFIGFFAALTSHGNVGMDYISKAIYKALKSEWVNTIMYTIQEFFTIFMVVLFWKVFLLVAPVIFLPFSGQ